jgi:hypothetical protein
VATRPHVAVLKVEADLVGRPNTPPVPHDEVVKHTPSIEMKEEVKEEDKVIGDDELKAIRTKLQEDRVFKEISSIDLKITWIGTWEADVSYLALCTPPHRAQLTYVAEEPS